MAVGAIAFGTVTWGTIYFYGAVLLVSTALSLMASSQARKGSSSQPGSVRGIQTNTMDTQVTTRVVYGTNRVGVNIVDMCLAGDNNKYLYLLGVLCEGEINKIVQVDGVDQVFLDNKLWNTYSGGEIYTQKGVVSTIPHALAAYEIFTGSASQSLCTTYAAQKPAWDSALRYTAYIYMRLEFDSDVFQGRPEITVDLEGLKIYNPDTEVTEFSNNPALVARDFMTRSSRRGGMGIAASRIDDDSVIAAAAYCTAKGWTCDIVLQEDKDAIDHLKEILSTFRGSVIYSGSQFRLTYRDMDYETSVMDITEDDVVESNGRSTLNIKQPSIFDTPNAIKMQYVNAEKDFSADEYILADSDAITEDGDYREKEIPVLGITSTANVQKMASYFLERMRVNKTAGMMTGTRCMALEPEDLVTVTHSRPGWSQKYMRVTQPTIYQNGEVGLELIEEYDTFYDDEYNLATHSFDDTNLPSPQTAVSSVINVVQSEEVYFYRNRSFTRWKINFDAPDPADYPWYDHADIWVKIGADGDWKFMTTAARDYVLDPVEEGVEYYCCIVSVSIWGAKQTFADGTVVSKLIAGKTTPPSNVPGFTARAHGDNVSLYATELTDPDVAGYEVRLGDAWNGGILIGFNETPNIRLNGVRPGTHTFWMAARDNSGNYSATPASATVTVYYPPGYADKNSWAWDYNGIGTHSNTEHTTYISEDALKCSHTGSVLTGTWTSPEYDLGSIKTVRVWGDFRVAMESSSGAWQDLLAAGTTWADVLDATTRWYEWLQPPVAGILTAKIKWGDTSGDLTNEADKLEILGIELSGRYVQIVVTITDPDLGSNIILNELNMKAAYWS